MATTPFNFAMKPASEAKPAPPAPAGFGSGAFAPPASSVFDFKATAATAADTASNAATPAAGEFKLGATAAPTAAPAPATAAPAAPTTGGFDFGASAKPAVGTAATTAAPVAAEFKFDAAAEKTPATTGGKPPMSPAFSMSNVKKKDADGGAAVLGAALGQAPSAPEGRSKMHPAEAKFALALSPLLPAAASSAPTGAAGSSGALKLVQGLDEEQTWQWVRSYLRHLQMEHMPSNTTSGSSSTSSAARLLDSTSKPALAAAQGFVLRERLSSVRVLLKVASVATRHPRHPHFEPCRACVASLVGNDGGASLFTRIVHQFVAAVSADQDPTAPTFGPPDAIAAARMAQNAIDSDSRVGKSMASGFSNDVLRVQALREGLTLCASLLLLLDAEDAEPMPPLTLDKLLVAVVARNGFEPSEEEERSVCGQEALLLKSLRSLSVRLCVRALRGLNSTAAADGGLGVHTRMEQWMQTPSSSSPSSSLASSQPDETALEPVRARLVLAWALECDRPEGLQAACQGRMDGWAFLDPFQEPITATAGCLTASHGDESMVSSSSSEVSSLEGQAVGSAAAGVALQLAQQLLLALQADTVEDVAAFGGLAAAGLRGQPMASKRIWDRRAELLNGGGGDSELLPQALSSLSSRSEEKEGDSAIVEFLEQQLRKPLASCGDGRAAGLELLGSLVNSTHDVQACQAVLEPALTNPTLPLSPHSLLAEVLAAVLGENLALPQQQQQPPMLLGGGADLASQSLSMPALVSSLSEVAVWQRCSAASHLLLAMVKYTHEMSSFDEAQEHTHTEAPSMNDPAVLLHEAIDQQAHRITHATFAKAITDRAMDLISATSALGASSAAYTIEQAAMEAHAASAVSGVLSLVTSIVREAPRPWADAVHATVADASPSSSSFSGSGNGTLPPLVSALDRVCRDVLSGRRPLYLAPLALDLGTALVEHGNIEPRVDLRTMFERFDSDGNGALDSDEFANGLASLGFHLSHDASLQLFRRIDADGDSNGEITYDELHAFAVQQQQQQQMASRGMLADSMTVDVQQLMASLVQPDASATSRARALSGSLCDAARSLASLAGNRRNAILTHNSGSSRSLSPFEDEDLRRWTVLRQSLVMFKALLGAGGDGSAAAGGSSSSSSLVGLGGSALGSLREAVQNELLSPDTDLHGAYLTALTGLASLALSSENAQPDGRVGGSNAPSALEALLLSPTSKYEHAGGASEGWLPLHFEGTSRASEVALDALHLLVHVLAAALEPDASLDLAANAVHLLAQPIPPLTGGSQRSSPRTGGFVRPSALVALVAYLDYPSPGRRLSLRPHAAVRLAACECLHLFAKVLHKHNASAAVNATPLETSTTGLDSTKVRTGSSLQSSIGARASNSALQQQPQQPPPSLLSLLGREHVPALRSSLRSLLDPANSEPLTLCHASMDFLVTLVEMHPAVAACVLQSDLREVPQSSGTSGEATAGAGGGAAAAASLLGRASGNEAAKSTNPLEKGRTQSSMPTPMHTVLELFDDPLFLLREKGLLQGDTLKGLNTLLENYPPARAQAKQKLEQAAAKAPDLSARAAAAAEKAGESSESSSSSGAAASKSGARKPTVLELCPDGLLEVVAEHYLNGASQVAMSSHRRNDRSRTKNTVSAALPGATKLVASLWRHRFQDSTLGCAAAALAERLDFWDRLLAPLLNDLDEAGCGVGGDGESVPFELLSEHESVSLPDYEVALSAWLDQHRDENNDDDGLFNSGSRPGLATQHCLELQTRADLLGIVCQERLYAVQTAKKKYTPASSSSSAATSPPAHSGGGVSSSSFSLKRWLREAANQNRWSAWQREHLRLDLNSGEVELLDAAAKREGVQLNHFLVPEVQRSEGSNYVYSLPKLQASFVNPAKPTSQEWTLLLLAERCNYVWSRADAQRRLSAATNAFMELDLQLRRGSSSSSRSRSRSSSSTSQRALSQRPTRAGSPSVRSPNPNNNSPRNNSPRGLQSPSGLATPVSGAYTPVYPSTPGGSSSAETPQGSSDFGTPTGGGSPHLSGFESPSAGGGGGSGGASKGDRGKMQRSFEGDQTSWAMIEALSNRLEILPIVKAGSSAAGGVVLKVASDHAASLNAMLFHQLFSLDDSLAAANGGNAPPEAMGRQRSRLRAKRGKGYEVLRRLRACSHRLGLQLHICTTGVGGGGGMNALGRPLLDPSLVAITKSGHRQQPQERLLVEVEVRLRLLSATLLLVHTLRTSSPSTGPSSLTALAESAEAGIVPFRSGDDEDDDNVDCLAELRHASELAAGTIPWAGAAKQALTGVNGSSSSSVDTTTTIPPVFGGSGKNAAEQLLSVAQAILTALLAGGLGGESAAAGWQHPQVLPSLLASLYATSEQAANAISRAHDLDYIALRVQDDRALRERRVVAGSGTARSHNGRSGGGGGAAWAPMKGNTSSSSSTAAVSNQSTMPPLPPPPLRPAHRRTQPGDLESASAVDALLCFLLGAARSRHLAPLLVKSGLIGQLSRNPMLHALKVEALRSYEVPFLVEHRHLRGYCVHPTGGLVPSPFLLEGWHGALNLCVALLQTTEGEFHEQALQQVLALVEQFWPLMLAPLQCQGPRRSGTSGSPGMYPRVSVAQLADAAAVLNLVAVLGEDVNIWRALQPHSLDQLLGLIPSRIADWTVLLGSSPCSSSSSSSSGSGEASGGQQSAANAKMSATRDAGGGHVFAVRMCADVVSMHFDGKRDEKQALKTGDKSQQDKKQPPVAGNTKVPSPLALPTGGNNKNKNEEEVNDDDYDDYDDDTWGEWVGMGDDSSSSSSSFAQRLEDELINALAPAMLFMRRTSQLSPVPRTHGRPRWLVPLATSHSSSSSLSSAPPAACVLPVGTFVHLQDGSRWCVSAAEPTYDASGSSSDVAYRLMQLTTSAVAQAVPASPDSHGGTKGGASESPQENQGLPAPSQVETAVAEIIQPSSAIAYAETPCGPLFLPRALFSFDPLSSNTVSVFRAQYLRDLAAPNPPSFGHLAQLLFFATSVLQAHTANTNDGGGSIDDEALEWHSSVVLVAETALWALVANVNAWERTREAAKYQARMGSHRGGGGGGTGGFQNQVLGASAAAGGGKDGNIAKKARAGEDEDELVVDALLMHVFTNCGLVADNNNSRVALPGSLLHELRSAEAALDPEGAPFFADEIKHVLMATDLPQEGDGIVAPDAAGTGARSSSGRLSIADRVAAATQRQQDRDAKQGGGKGRGQASVNFDWT